MRVGGKTIRKSRGKWNPAIRIRFRRYIDQYALLGEGLNTRVAREEDEDTVGSLEYDFSGGQRPMICVCRLVRADGSKKQ
jgi:hypothetical protein